MRKTYGICPKCGNDRSYLFCDPYCYDLYSIYCSACHFSTDDYVFPDQAIKEWKWLQENPTRISLFQVREYFCSKVSKARQDLSELRKSMTKKTFCYNEFSAALDTIEVLLEKIRSASSEELQKCKNPPENWTTALCDKEK